MVDRIDWRPDTIDRSRGLARLGASLDGRGDVWSVSDKTAAAAQRFLTLLGLVDSEAWAWGRLQTRALPSGTTLRDHMLDWVDAGSPDVPVLTEEDLEHVLSQGDSNLVDYWNRAALWVHGGRDVELRR